MVVSVEAEVRAACGVSDRLRSVALRLSLMLDCRSWQKLRSQDLTMERQLILDAIKKFEDREQDNNRRIRAMLTPQTQPAPYVNGDAGSSARTTALPAVNGNGNTSKRGKKRKAD